MSIDWIWKSKDRAGVQPAIGDQLVDINGTFLQVRNPWIADSAFMGKLYASALIAGSLGAAWFFLADFYSGSRFDYALLVSVIVMLIFASLMLAVRVCLIKYRSDFVFDRSNRKVYYRERRRVISGDWNSVVGGLQSKLEFTGRAVITTHSLILRMQAESIERGIPVPNPVTLFVSIESNDPSDPNILYVGQVWEFIRLFMDNGPDKLPEPAGSNWWYVPHLRLCLTPAEALRHYVPWRTGEPNERQGKNNWLLPLWLIFFPYNMFCALCWYAVCRTLNVCGMPPPVQITGIGNPDSRRGRKLT